MSDNPTLQDPRSLYPAPPFPQQRRQDPALPKRCSPNPITVNNPIRVTIDWRDGAH